MSLRKGDSLYKEETTAANVVIMSVSKYQNTSILVLTRNSATNEVILWRVDSGGATNIYAVVLAWAPTTYSNSAFGQYVYFFSSDGTNEHSIKYDGTTVSLSGYSAATGSAATFVILGAGVAYKNRHYLPRRASTGYWYSQISAVTGTCKYVDLASILSTVGYITNIATFTLSDQVSAEQIIAFITNNGEVLFYTGDSPESANWTVAGSAIIGRPYALDSGCAYQGDYILATEQGIVSLRDLFLKGSGSGTLQTLNSNVTNSWQKSVEDYGVGTGGVVDCLFDPLGNRLLFNFPVPYGRPPPGGDSEGHTFYVFGTDTLAWSLHTRRYVKSPTLCRKSVIWNNAVYYITYREDTNGVQQSGFKILKKEGADIFGDITSGILTDPIGVNFQYISAPVSNGRLYVQKCGGMDVIMQSDINDSVFYQLYADFGAQTTNSQAIPATAFELRKTWVNIGIEGSFIQYRMVGTAPTGAGLFGLYLYGFNFWTEQGRSPR